MPVSGWESRVAGGNGNEWSECAFYYAPGTGAISMQQWVMSNETPPMGPQAIQAPWRLAYLETVDEKGNSSSSLKAGSGSFLLDYWRDSARDVENHVIMRTQDGLIMLNAFPYSNGHLLVALGDARPTLLDYEPAQRAAFWKLVEQAADILQRVLQPQGINIGINQGRAAGAGVPQHMHGHLVPRWSGDVNFMTTVGQVRVVPASLDAMAMRLRGHDEHDENGRHGGHVATGADQGGKPPA